MKSIDYLKKHREEKGLSWRGLAKMTGVSEAYWFRLMDGSQPPTLERAQQIAEITEMEKEVFVDLVFRDRLIRFLEKEGMNGSPPTPNIWYHYCHFNCRGCYTLGRKEKR